MERVFALVRRLPPAKTEIENVSLPLEAPEESPKQVFKSYRFLTMRLWEEVSLRRETSPSAKIESENFDIAPELPVFLDNVIFKSYGFASKLLWKVCLP